MKVLDKAQLVEGSEPRLEILRTLNSGGLVCLPCAGQYRVCADLHNSAAVARLLQSKRRTRNAPSLVFVSDERMLTRVAAALPEIARRILLHPWPGPVTILLEASPELPAKVSR